MNCLSKLYWLCALVTILSCVKSGDFEQLNEACNNEFAVTKTVEDIYTVSTNEATRYSEEDIIEGYIVSSDQSGNFFKTLSLQALDGRLGFSIALDQTDLYTNYNPGRKVFIQLNNTYTEIDDDALKIGALFIDIFNNETVGRISYPAFEEILIKSCEVIDENQLVKSISIDSVSDRYLNTLVEFRNVQFIQNALGSTLYDSNNDEGGSATNHLIEDMSGNNLIFRTSAFADFASLDVPDKSGIIRGVLTKFKGAYQLVTRTTIDINLTMERFEVILKNNLFFTELADPNNNSKARFIEIYNAEDEAINLNGWTIRRYTNDNTTISSTIDLSGYSIQSNQAFVIAANGTEFEAVFGFPPDLDSGTNGPADSNGDDNLELVDSEGTIVDIFGVIGEDGSGTTHEFEDGRALRKNSVMIGNPIFIFGEWQVWNDSGIGGTINDPQDAPGNFSPGVR